ncbi:phosphate ABC transporter substrate-binding protein PstS [Mesorhizobium zhangyense]|uniref:phosphate ABC transporter substrate-binding protein PstS n=1 Tax=Mesorhizobium zhangyense TaxID=1776730 RepID=UPI0028ABCF9A|nr:phosphate ABC transporter substrate-binding protein PstS [Mesorhizobium zhangyense]
MVDGLAGAAILAIALTFGQTAQAEPIRGAGSTFAAPVMAKWARAYKDARADGGDFFTLDWTVDYELVGSLAGLMRLEQPEMDFAATDVPVAPSELASRGQQQFPIVMGGIAIVTNIDGVAPGALRLTGPVLADIYLGKIQTWSDPAIKALNPDLDIPDLQISVVHRKDGSGSTFVLTEYFTAVSAEWKTKYGADTLIPWPVGTSAEGTKNLILAVQETKGAIAYAEYGQVMRAGLPFASIQNKSGNFVKPDPEGVQAAANAIAWEKTQDFYASLTDQPGPAAYPISTATFAVVPIAGRSPDRYRRVHDLFRLAFDDGDSDAAALGYVPLPEPLAEQVKQYWVKELQAGN